MRRATLAYPRQLHPTRKKGAALFWEALLESLEGESESPVLMLGDLNACLPRVDTTATASLFSAKYFKRLASCGYTDMWRTMNDSTADICTWQGSAHPYRLDHAFGTASIVPRVRSCAYDHSVRLAGLSDHSLLSISIDVDTALEQHASNPDSF